MNHKRVLALANRVMRQIGRDRRTVGLFLFGPMIMLTLGALLFRSEAGAIPMAVINQDEGVRVALIGEVSLAERIIEVLADTEGVQLVALDATQVGDALREGRIQGVVTFPPGFSATFAETRQARIPLRLEGANPTQALVLQGNLTRASMTALANMAALSGIPSIDMKNLPITIETEYLYGGPEFDLLDFFAPAYIAVIVFFFAFILTTVSFLRERSQGTMERLMATPATRLEMVTGYMIGFLVFGVAQAVLLLLYTVYVVGIHNEGNLLTVFLVQALLVIVAVNLGILLSTFARNEFQVLQFIPIVIFPMVLLSGLVWPVKDLPAVLQPLAYIMPLTYANNALRDVMIKGFGLVEVWTQLAMMGVLAVAMLILAAMTIRREVV
jgi:ABC-2 type transport system permease protein